MFSDKKSLRKCLLLKKYVQHFKVKLVFFFKIWEVYFEKVGIHWFMIEQIQFDISYKKTKDRIWGLNTKLFLFLCVWNMLLNLARSQMESVHFVSSKEHFWLKMWNWFSSGWEWKKEKKEEQWEERRYFDVENILKRKITILKRNKSNSANSQNKVEQVLYILTSVWVLCIPNAGWNSHFQHFLC